MNETLKLIEAIADEKWDKLVQQSNNGTIFLSSVYLKNASINYKLYYCYKNEELRAGVALIESTNKKEVILDDLIIYNGIFYNQTTNKQNHAQELSEHFKIQEFIANKLIQMYQNIQLSLHPSIVDIRAILWVNYGTELTKFTSSIRYTSYVNIADFRYSKTLEEISLYNKASTSRRQQIRYAINKGYKTKVLNDTSKLIEFYQKTMERQGIAVKKEKLIKMEKLSSSLIENHIAKIYATYDDFDELGSMALFSWDSKRAYYIFGANDPNKRKGHSGSAVLWDAFHDLSNMGILEVDLEGINSPLRGWFKLSFGGDIVPYYEVKLGE